jgi:hypothetical protein
VPRSESDRLNEQEKKDPVKPTPAFGESNDSVGEAGEDKTRPESQLRASKAAVGPIESTHAL